MPKRKNGIMPVTTMMTMAQIQAKRRKTQEKQHVQSTQTGAKRRADEVVTWLVENEMTQALTSNQQEGIGFNKWWFNWKKVDKLSEPFMDFLTSKERQLPPLPATPQVAGLIIPESTDNLSKYRSALYLYRQKARILDKVTLDPDKVSLYEETLAGYFKSASRAEGQLKQKGLLTKKKGGGLFSMEMYREFKVKLWDACEYKYSLFNKLAFHTCGRTKNVGEVNVDHFTLDGDCLGLQFPITKTDQCGARGEDITIHFFAASDSPVDNLFLDFGVYFACLHGGPVGGRIFPGSTKPATGFRASFKRMFTEDYLKTKYALTCVVNILSQY